MTQKSLKYQAPLTPEKLDNARQNIWIYRLSNGAKRNALGVSGGLLRQYEMGRAAIPPEHLTRIAARLGVPTSALTASPDYTQILTPPIRRVLEDMCQLDQTRRGVLVHLLRLLRR